MKMFSNFWDYEKHIRNDTDIKKETQESLRREISAREKNMGRKLSKRAISFLTSSIENEVEFYLIDVAFDTYPEARFIFNRRISKYKKWMRKALYLCDEKKIYKSERIKHKIAMLECNYWYLKMYSAQDANERLAGRCYADRVIASSSA